MQPDKKQVDQPPVQPSQQKKDAKKKAKKPEPQKQKFETGVYIERSEEQKKLILDQWLQQGKKDRHQQKFVQAITSDKHGFWPTQPTVKWDQKVIKGGPVHEPKTVADVKKQPQELPEGFEWCEINLSGKDTKDLDEFYTLLTQNYVEDDEGTFRFDYSREFLKWALTPPDFNSKWHVGIRSKGKLVASITAIPVTVIIEGVRVQMGEVNFLCAHKSLREKRLAPVLIKQITRRIHLKDKWQAIYTAGRVLPTPFCKTTYWHRSLNPIKLVDVRFSGMGPNMTKARLAKLYKLPGQMTTDKLRPMTKKDVPGVYKFINEQLEKYTVKFHFSEAEVRHFFIPIPNVIVTYVVGTPEAITDMFSFYSLPSHVMNNDKHNMLNACYSFYNFATTMPYTDLIQNALVVANDLKYDVYNCLDIMNNKTVFEKLNFVIGDGHLNYYFYNWGLAKETIAPEQLATVLV